MARTVTKIAVEFKNYRVGGEMVDKVIGTAMRLRGREPSAALLEVIVFCRGYTAEAKSRAAEIETAHNLRVTFKVIP